MADRYYVSASLAGDEVELTGPEAHHLLNVMRAKVGDRVELFDGRGTSATGEITAARKKSATIQIVDRRDEFKTPTFQLTLATAVPKGERFRWLVEKATELGVDRLVPLTTARGVVHPGEGKLDKMQQTVIAACKQSGRSRLMTIEDRMGWSDFVARELENSLALVAHPGGAPMGDILSTSRNVRSIVIAVGPEGGFTDSEIEQAVGAGAQLVSLGPNILRTETAAVAMAATVLLSRDATN